MTGWVAGVRSSASAAVSISVFILVPSMARRQSAGPWCRIMYTVLPSITSVNDAPCQTHVMIHREVKARSGLMPSRGRGLDVAIQKSGRPDGQQCRMNCTILETLAQPPFVCHRDMLEKSNAALSDALQLLSPHMDLSSPKMLSRPRSSTNLC